MRRRARRSAVRTTSLVAALLAVLAAAACSQCPTCPKHTEPVHLAPPSSSH